MATPSVQLKKVNDSNEALQNSFHYHSDEPWIGLGAGAGIQNRLNPAFCGIGFRVTLGLAGVILNVGFFS